jgi:hypothetical protein
MPPLTGLFILWIAVLQICRAYGAFHPCFICVQSVAEKIMPTSLIHRIGIATPAEKIYRALTTDKGIPA